MIKCALPLGHRAQQPLVSLSGSKSGPPNTFCATPSWPPRSLPKGLTTDSEHFQFLGNSLRACMHAFSEYLLSSSSPPGSLRMLGQRAPTAKPCPTEPASRGHETRARAHILAPSLTSCVTADLSQDLSKPRQGDEWAEKPACLHGCNED